MKIIWFEIKKILKIKVFLIALIVFVIADIYIINLKHKSSNNDIDGHEIIYNQICGEITDEKIDFVKEKYNELSLKINSNDYTTEKTPNTYTGYIFGDCSEFENFYNELKYRYEYEFDISKKMEKCKNNIKFYEEKGNVYEKRNSEKIMEIYSDRFIDNFYENRDVKQYIEYDISTIFVIILLLFVVPALFFLEKDSKMIYLIESSKKGCSNVMISKLMAIIVMTTCISVLFSLVDFFSFYYIYNLDGLWEKLYSIKEYAMCTTNMTIVGCIISFNICKMVFYIFLAMLIYAISAYTMKSSNTSIISIVLVGIMMYCCICIDTVFNPFVLLKYNEIIKNYSSINVLGRPILKSTIIVLNTGIYMIIFIVFLLIKFRKGIIIKNWRCKRGPFYPRIKENVNI